MLKAMHRYFGLNTPWFHSYVESHEENLQKLVRKMSKSLAKSQDFTNFNLDFGQEYQGDSLSQQNNLKRIKSPSLTPNNQHVQAHNPSKLKNIKQTNKLNSGAGTPLSEHEIESVRKVRTPKSGAQKIDIEGDSKNNSEVDSLMASDTDDFKAKYKYQDLQRKARAIFKKIPYSLTFGSNDMQRCLTIIQKAKFFENIDLKAMGNDIRTVWKSKSLVVFFRLLSRILIKSLEFADQKVKTGCVNLYDPAFGKSNCFSWRTQVVYHPYEESMSFLEKFKELQWKPTSK